MTRDSASIGHAMSSFAARVRRRYRSPLHTLPLAACMLWSACADSRAGASVDHGATGDAGAQVHVRFDLASGGIMSLGDIPWPDDLYLDKQSHVALSDFPEPNASPDYALSLRDSLSDLDGYGISTPIYFFVDGAIDPATLPQSAEESVGTRASVFLVDADTGSPEAFQRVRVEVQWSAGLSRIAMRPALGHPLTPGGTYAALVTRKVKDLAGQPLAASDKFASVIDATQSLSDARMMQARAEYTPVLDTLAHSGLARSDVVGMAVFRVQSVSPDLDAARKIVRAGNPPVPANLVEYDGKALDGALGGPNDPPPAAAHDNLLAMVHGTLSSPNFCSATSKAHGAWEHDETGQLRVKRIEDLPFTLFVPNGNGASPIVIYQHQLGRERSDAVVLANVLAKSNIAVLAIDAPFQGLRARSDGLNDTVNRFTGAQMPDRFGDVPGDFYGAQETQGGLLPLHPFYARDAMRQGAVDLMTLVRFAEEGDFSAITSTPALKGRRFGAPRIGFVGEDLGAQLGVLLAPSEPSVQALVLFGASAFVSQSWWLSAGDQGLFAQLATLLGRDATNIDYQHDPPAFWPGLAIFDTLLGRAEPLAYASSLRRAPQNALLLEAKDDESVSNLTTEALAVSLGATFLSGQARYVGDLATQTAAAGQPISGNFAIEGGNVTRLLQAYDPADHALLLSQSGSAAYVHPPDPPFQMLSDAMSIDNPHAAALDEIAAYFSSFFACVKAVNPSSAAIKCAGAVNAPNN